MKSVLLIIVATFMLSSLGANAAAIKTKNQALTVCKNHVANSFPDFRRSTLKKLKKKKGHYIIKLKVFLADQSEIVSCNVDRDTGMASLDK